MQKTLSIKIAGKLAIMLLCALFIATLGSYMYADQRATDEYESRLIVLDEELKVYADLISEPVWGFDYKTVKSILSILISQADVINIIVLDDNNQKILDLPTLNSHHEVLISYSIPVVFSAPNVTKHIGRLIVDIGNHSLIEKRKDTLFDLISLSIGVFFLLSIASWLFVKYVVSRPLNAILFAISESRGDDHFCDIDHVANDEFGIVIGEYNNLQKRLQIQHQNLKESGERITTLYNTTPSIMFSLSLDGDIIEANDYFTDYFKLSRNRAINQKFLNFVDSNEFDIHKDVLHPLLVDNEVHEIFVLIKVDGESRPVLLDARLHIENNTQKVLAVMTDISGLVATQKELDRQATHDLLTGLLNRFGFQNKVEKILRNSAKSDAYALIIIDLDHFKSINDIFGHQIGDSIIQILSKRIINYLPVGSVSARLGGDEFAVLIKDQSAGVPNNIDISNVCNNILECLSLPILIEERTMNLSGSLGVSYYPKDASSVNELLRNADIAMYRAKQMGRGTEYVFEQALQHEITEKARYEAILRRALEADTVLVYYQPIIDLNLDGVVGAEALVRLKDPDTGDIIFPDLFISIAEDTGLIIQLGKKVLEKAVEDTQLLRDKFKEDFYISVNFSNRQFQQGNLVETVKDVLYQSQLPAHLLLVELTESLLIQNNSQSHSVLKSLHDLGCKLAIDDFGTGYSALSYLNQFPIDILKIDRSFISKCESNATDQSLVAAILNMSKGLNMKVVAEGIENEYQREFLISKECHLGQGYFFSRPVPFDKFDQYVENYGVSHATA
ncbi:putative bifunctional diguanylate cyclase/phosphodiesterase [Marinomonas sp. 2405UD68-3]|uniref:putative bifunctional diguanylate cyclase/phosphodiesterase n=1 Tax=Marinomonas sp. 2405UD68-3 TaxID=3391835 RepID=UPI0039C9607C